MKLMANYVLKNKRRRRKMESKKKKGLVETLTMEESSEGDNVDKCH